MRPDTPGEAPPGPILFLFGPPGVGKSTLGSRACRELGLRFLDLAAAAPANSGGDPDPDMEQLAGLVADREADVIEIPWRVQRERKVLCYGAPRGERVLEHFDGPPWEIEFRHRFSDSPALVARYRKSLDGFARFLKGCGDLPQDEE